ncbi:MAG: hypothetical protein QOE86_1520 [Solirubrobacteraceae bacterium]|nr:hypothetical protein [Solirubrobacteraceae bacterium]
MTLKQGSRALAALAVAAPLALSATALAGGNPHGTPPGQAKAEATPAATPTATATPEVVAKARPAHPAHPVKPAHPAHPAKPVHPAEPAHSAHPATPAPGGKSAAAPGHNKITICHATGSATNPYVTITIPPPAVRAHARHQDGRDIIPAPPGGCPSTTPAAATTTTSTTTATAKTAPAAVAAPATPSLQVLAERTSGHASAHAGTTAPRPARGRSGVLGEDAHRESGSGTPAAATLAAASASPAGGLPFTGFDAALVLTAGLAALLGGLALRRAARTATA